MLLFVCTRMFTWYIQVERIIQTLFYSIGSPALTQRYGEWMAPLSSLYTFARARTKQLFYRNE